MKEKLNAQGPAKKGIRFEVRYGIKSQSGGKPHALQTLLGI
jgi:hypothetical protein